MVAAVFRTARRVIRVSRSPAAGAGVGVDAGGPAASTRRTKPLPSSSSATLAPTAGTATPSANLAALRPGQRHLVGVARRQHQLDAVVAELLAFLEGGVQRVGGVEGAEADANGDLHRCATSGYPG